MDVTAQAQAAARVGQHVEGVGAATRGAIGRVVDPWKQATHKVTTHVYQGLKTPGGQQAYPGIPGMGPGASGIVRTKVKRLGALPGSSIPSASVMKNRPAALGLFLAHHASGGGLVAGGLAHAKTRATAKLTTSGVPQPNTEQFAPPVPPPSAAPLPNPWGGKPKSQPLGTPRPPKPTPPFGDTT